MTLPDGALGVVCWGCYKARTPPAFVKAMAVENGVIMIILMRKFEVQL